MLQVKLQCSQTSPGLTQRGQIHFRKETFQVGTSKTLRWSQERGIPETLQMNGKKIQSQSPSATVHNIRVAGIELNEVSVS